MVVADSYHVVVLRSGMAGLATVLAASERGLRPLLIEKSDSLEVAPPTLTDSSGSETIIWRGPPVTRTTARTSFAICAFWRAARNAMPTC
jgi:flavin-dependent dehydrogenase